jgi:hypothetical protein
MIPAGRAVARAIDRLARVGSGLILAAIASSVMMAAAGELPPMRGEAIYRSGTLGSGAPLEGTQVGASLRVAGRDAACTNCHQRSGLGVVEGQTRVPPVAGEYLFHPVDKRTGEFALPYVGSMRQSRQPYSDESLARAIRDGIDSDGHPLGPLMPRFTIDDADMAALIDYLKALEVRTEPGVTDSVLHFATVFTPDVAPARRQAVLDVINAYFADKNRFQYGPSAKLQGSVHTKFAASMFMANRRWQLHVWDLRGPAGTWKEQLAKRLAAEPVFAVVSGLGGSQWRPVHDFCEESALPCLFPNVDAPIDAPGDFYTVYLSKGVGLESELIASRLLAEGDVGVVDQVYRLGDSGADAARALSRRLREEGRATREHPIPASAPAAEVARHVRAAMEGGTVVLWLRPSDLAALGPAPADGKAVWVSGLMGGLEGAPLSPGWQRLVHMTYPFELPGKRVVRVDFARGWFNIRHIPVVDERLQVDTYLACGLLAETIGHLGDTFVRPYLIEQLQAGIEHRIITGYYPHLTLATNQHFASKGAYVVRFAASDARDRVVAETGWVVP